MRPHSAAATAINHRSYNSGYSKLAILVSAGVFQTYSATPGYGDDHAAEPTPAYGSLNVQADGASFLCAAPEVWTNAACDTAAVCTGYKVYTNAFVYAEGVATNFTYVHPDCANGASLVWQWDAEYKSTATSTGTGTVSPAEQWTAHGDSVTLSATPGAGWAFHKWTGDVPPGLNVYAPTISFLAGRPRALVAEFEPTNPGTIIMMQ